MHTHPLDGSAHDLSLAIHQQRISCRQVMQLTLERIAQRNPQLNAIVSLRDETSLLAEADAHDAMLARGKTKGWLHGIPQAIKDTTTAASLPHTFGSPLMATHVPTEDGVLAQRTKACGAIVIGKTNVPEFGLGSHTFNSVFGPTHNPYDTTKTPGGSSGGAAVALASRMLVVADGSDFMGSLRNPAAWCNVFGFRPSAGRVPQWPMADVWLNQLTTEGPMARHVRDLRLLLATQAGHDARLPLSLGEPWLPPQVTSKTIANNAQNTATPHVKPFKNGVQRLRVGYLGDLGGHLALEAGVSDALEQGLARFTLLGHEVEAAQLPVSPAVLWECWLVWRKLLVTSRIAPFLLNPANRKRIKPEALWEHDQGLQLGARAVAQASELRSQFYQGLLRLFDEFDVLALPAAQVWPFDIATRHPKHIAGRGMDTYHRWMECTIYATLGGLPAISVPCGFQHDGAHALPMGLQLMGPPQADWQLLDVAEQYESAIGDWLSRTPAAARP